MQNWLSQYFVRIGMIAAVVDVASRIYSQVVLNYLAELSVAWSWSLNYTTRFAYLSTALDVAATILWWMFMFGLAFRLLKRVEPVA